MTGYLKQQIPRIDGQPYTAPQYDSVTTIAVAPIPAACYILNVDGAEDCRCRTQQGTKYETTQGECRRVVHDGFFQTWASQQAGATQKTAEVPRSDPSLLYGGEPFPARSESRLVDAASLRNGV